MKKEAKIVTEKDDNRETFCSCFESSLFAEKIKKIWQQPGIGSLYSEIMKKIREQSPESTCSRHPVPTRPKTDT
jgi:hypothetical protein